MSACALIVGIAAQVAVSLEFSGAYYALAAGISGGIVVVAAGAALIAGRRPSRAAWCFALALVLLGSWSLLSTTWNGLPDVSWRFLGLTITAAAAGVLGSCIAASDLGRRVVLAGVALGIGAHALVLLVAVGTRTAPESWFDGRQLAGPVGYHNAQAAALVLGSPLALWVAASARPWVRAAGAAGAAVILGDVLLTQSRGALLALAISAVAQAGVSRRLRIAALIPALAACGAVLIVLLRSVDRALVDQRFDDPAFTRFAVAVAVCAVLLAGASIPQVRVRYRPSRKHVAFAGSGVVAILVVAGALSAAALGHRIHNVYHRLTVEPNQTAQVGAGETRLASVSLTGRMDQWRIAAHMIGEKPLQGSGTGTFARRWGHDRPVDNLYVLQPHSIELELLAELGIVGLGLFVAAFGALGTGIVRNRNAARDGAAVAAGLGLAFLFQASLDWVFSFAGLLVPLLLVLGAASPGRLVTAPLGRSAAYVVAVVGGVVLLAGPALGQLQLDRARDDGVDRFDAAWSSAARAVDFDRWNADSVSYQGLLAESAGDYQLAATFYARAAELSQQPWVETYRRARALDRAGLTAASRAACVTTIRSDPLDRSLQTGVCDNVDAGV